MKIKIARNKEGKREVFIDEKEMSVLDVGVDLEPGRLPRVTFTVVPDALFIDESFNTYEKS